MVVSKGKPMRPAEVALLEISDKFSNPPSYEVSGEVIQTDNAADLPLLSLTVHGKSVQDGTPTPESPVPVQVVDGANIIEPTYGNKVPSVATGELVTANGWTCELTPILSGADYYFRVFDMTGQAYVFFYDENENYLGHLIGPTVVGSGFFLSNTNYANTAKYFRVRSDNNRATNPQFVAAHTSTAINGYIPVGSIGLQIGETVMPIHLQGRELAGLPDGTSDILTLSRNGEIKVVQNVGVVDLGTLDWVVDRTHWVCWAGIPGAVRPSLDTVKANMIAEGLPVVTYSQVLDGAIGIGLGTARYPIANTGDTENAPSGLLYYQLDTPITYTLPSITPPTPVNGGILRIVANITPEIDASYIATGMQGGILVLNTCAEELASLDGRVTRLENELDNF